MSSVVVVDGLALALVVSATGGYGSALLFLVFLEVVAVTLLVSYPAGLKLATWCALLLLLAHAAADAGIIDVRPAVTDRVAGVTAATFLLFAVCRGRVLVGERAVAAPQPAPARAPRRHRAPSSSARVGPTT